MSLGLNCIFYLPKHAKLYIVGKLVLCRFQKCKLLHTLHLPKYCNCVSIKCGGSAQGIVAYTRFIACLSIEQVIARLDFVGLS